MDKTAYRKGFEDRLYQGENTPNPYVFLVKYGAGPTHVSKMKSDSWQLGFDNANKLITLCGFIENLENED